MDYMSLQLFGLNPIWIVEHNMYMFLGHTQILVMLCQEFPNKFLLTNKSLW